jgi:hypothetical protein
MDKVDFYALGADKGLISLLAPTETQWNRKYYECGDFSIQLPIDQYNKDIEYVYCNKRPELGHVMKRQYKIDEKGFRYIQISGYFEEYLLENDIIYPAYGAGSGSHTDFVVSDIVNTYKSSPFSVVTPTNFLPGCDIAPELGKSLMEVTYGALQEKQASYRMNYDYENNSESFSIWRGRDLTQENTDRNNQVTFSINFKNLKNPDVLIDNSNYKNYCIIQSEVNGYTLTEIVDNRKAGEVKKAVYISTTIDKPDNVEWSENDYRAKMREYARQELKNTYGGENNTAFEFKQGSYEYMVDFDLGDKVSVELNPMEISQDVRIVAVSEVWRGSEHTLNFEVGNNILK